MTINNYEDIVIVRRLARASRRGNLLLDGSLANLFEAALRAELPTSQESAYGAFLLLGMRMKD
jgi:hypothetical protein